MEYNKRLRPVDGFTHGRQFFNIKFSDLVYEGYQLPGQPLRYARDAGHDNLPFESLLGKRDVQMEAAPS